jgi:hypothetical protein
MRAVVILTLAALAACSSEKKDNKNPDGSRPAAVSDADVALAGDWVALYGQYAAAMEGAASDCAKAAAAVSEVNQKQLDLIAKGKPRIAALRGDPATARWFDDNYKKTLGAALDRMAPTLDRCRGDAAMSAALAAGAFERKPDAAAPAQPR